MPETTGTTTTTAPAANSPTTVDVKIPVWVKALPYAGAAGGAFFAYKRHSKVGGYIGWIALGTVVGMAIAIPFGAKAGFKSLLGKK